MRFLIELYGFPLRTTDLAVSVKLWEVSAVKGEPSPPCPGHKLLLAPLPPSGKAEGQPRNYENETPQLQPVECTLPKLKTKP